MRPGVYVGASKEARAPLRRCHSRSVLGAARHTPPQEGVQRMLRGRVILLQIDKQRVRVFKLTIFKLALCSIAKFELLVMQYNTI